MCVTSSNWQRISGMLLAMVLAHTCTNSGVPASASGAVVLLSFSYKPLKNDCGQTVVLLLKNLSLVPSGKIRNIAESELKVIFSSLEENHRDVISANAVSAPSGTKSGTVRDTQVLMTQH